MDQQGGVLLDAVLALGLILVAAFALNALGVTFPQILQGAEQFFGM